MYTTITTILHSQFPRKTPLLIQSSPPPPSITHFLRPPRTTNIRPPLCTTSSDGGQGGDTDERPPPLPNLVEIKFRRGSRRRQRERQGLSTEVREPMSMATQSRITQAPSKSWEEMTLSEKAVELYMGEKGLLFWVNKFAYASIFIVIGGWILFRNWQVAYTKTICIAIDRFDQMKKS
ncbi:hypothetical protein Cgig2_019602 [Carnegiea gigantea]|uniref:Uncharacterized protein n=1 Tax=Carnegiea gigantea TaxID=171969 RepID=A0A9Q1KIM4_9CARY|nr:hypothetical protein Cgig2_019602 [Carnegiea gigantea]